MLLYLYGKENRSGATVQAESRSFSFFVENRMQEEGSLLSRLFSGGTTSGANPSQPPVRSWQARGGGIQFPGQIKQVKGTAFQFPLTPTAQLRRSESTMTSSKSQEVDLGSNNTSNGSAESSKQNGHESSPGKKDRGMSRSRSESDLRSVSSDSSSSFRSKRFQTLLEQPSIDIGTTSLLIVAIPL